MSKQECTKALTPKEELFCIYYAPTQNAREAAAKSGCGGIFAEKTGEKLLQRSEIRQKCKSLAEERAVYKNVRCGLERLAFGSIADAVALITAEEGQRLDVGELDLFNVAEIKRKKGGEYEIKFFDRLKAFEKLLELDAATRTDSAGAFFSAIAKGAAALQSDTEA